jgi:hypothetical protein
METSAYFVESGAYGQNQAAFYAQTSAADDFTGDAYAADKVEVEASAYGSYAELTHAEVTKLVAERTGDLYASDDEEGALKSTKIDDMNAYQLDQADSDSIEVSQTPYAHFIVLLNVHLCWRSFLGRLMLYLLHVDIFICIIALHDAQVLAPGLAVRRSESHIYYFFIHYRTIGNTPANPDVPLKPTGPTPATPSQMDFNLQFQRIMELEDSETKFEKMSQLASPNRTARLS